MKKYLEDKIKEITKNEAVELFKTEFDVDLDSYNSYDLQYRSYESENFSCESEVVKYFGRIHQGDDRWNISRIFDKKTGEAFFVKFDGFYSSWDGTDWSNNDWSIVRPHEVKVIQWF